MTVLELYNSVAQLGFEDSLEDESRFLFSANRALLQVNALRPATRTCIINHEPLKNLVSENTFSPLRKTTDLYFEAIGAKSYYFETCGGEGKFIIEKYTEEGWKELSDDSIESSKIFKCCKGFVFEDGDFLNENDRVRLRFTGDYLYSVRNVAMYKEFYSKSEEDIPEYKSYVGYDISTLVDDFLALDTSPVKINGDTSEINRNYDIENDRIVLLPYDESGLYKVIYRKKPQEITGEMLSKGDKHSVDLDEELCSLLPILVASYIWIDDEPEKAEYYLILYRERAVDFERRLSRTAPVNIKNVYGW